MAAVDDDEQVYLVRQYGIPSGAIFSSFPRAGWSRGKSRWQLRSGNCGRRSGCRRGRLDRPRRPSTRHRVSPTSVSHAFLARGLSPVESDPD